MLSNAYFLAKFRFDTAENGPAKNLQNFANFANPNPYPLGRRVAAVGGTGNQRRQPGGRLADRRLRLHQQRHFPAGAHQLGRPGRGLR